MWEDPHWAAAHLTFPHVEGDRGPTSSQRAVVSPAHAVDATISWIATLPEVLGLRLSLMLMALIEWALDLLAYLVAVS